MAFEELFRNWKEVEEFEAASVIFAERDEADDMFFILEGEVDLSLQGNVLDRESKGGIIGEMAIVDSAVQNATAIARTDVRLARIDRARLDELINKNARFSAHVMAALANRLRAVDRYITQRTADNG